MAEIGCGMDGKVDQSDANAAKHQLWPRPEALIAYSEEYRTARVEKAGSCRYRYYSGQKEGAILVHHLQTSNCFRARDGKRIQRTLNGEGLMEAQQTSTKTDPDG